MSLHPYFNSSVGGQRAASNRPPLPSSFTLSDVQRLSNKRDTCLMVIEDKVYDVTGFLSQHPGGKEILLKFVGTNATAAFRRVGHTRRARDLLSQCYVGPLKPSDS
eukprot:scpid44062/ scgid29523/ Cytochrome b5 type B; Cytochrome b5 outer mitochondrial membrane isoform